MKDFKLSEYERNRPIGVRFKDDYVWVTRKVRRTIGNPLEWHPWLAESPAEKLVNIEMSVFSIYWPDFAQRKGWILRACCVAREVAGASQKLHDKSVFIQQQQ